MKDEKKGSALIYTQENFVLYLHTFTTYKNREREMRRGGILWSNYFLIKRNFPRYIKEMQEFPFLSR